MCQAHLSARYQKTTKREGIAVLLFFREGYYYRGVSNLDRTKKSITLSVVPKDSCLSILYAYWWYHAKHLIQRNVTAGYDERRHIQHDGFTFQNSLTLDIMHSTYLWSRSFLLGILLITLQLIVVLLVRWWPRTIVLSRKVLSMFWNRRSLTD